MITLIATIFIASLFGSLHCAGMCGAFVTLAVSEGADNRRKRILLNVAYNGGRLTTYVLLGAVAGSLGALIDMGGALAGFSRAAVMLSGAVMVLFGISAGMAAFGKRPIRVPIPGVMTKMLTMGHRLAMRFGPVRRALTIGLLTTMLPCGWLYAFAAVAAGTASPVLGGLTMAVFWLGTLPVLVTLGVGVQKLTGAVGRKLPHFTAAALIAVGLWALIGRGMIDANTLASQQTVYEDPDAAQTAAESVGDTTPACCQESP